MNIGLRQNQKPMFFFCNLLSSVEGFIHLSGVAAVTFDPGVTLLCKYIQVCNIKIMCLCLLPNEL